MQIHQIITTIVQRRKALGLSQAQLGVRAGVSRRSIVDLEAGRHDIGLRKLLRLLAALDLTMSFKEGRERPIEGQLLEFFAEDDD